jgi:hypothetical protein
MQWTRNALLRDKVAPPIDSYRCRIVCLFVACLFCRTSFNVITRLMAVVKEHALSWRRFVMIASLGAPADQHRVGGPRVRFHKWNVNSRSPVTRVVEEVAPRIRADDVICSCSVPRWNGKLFRMRGRVEQEGTEDTETVVGSSLLSPFPPVGQFLLAFCRANAGVCGQRRCAGDRIQVRFEFRFDRRIGSARASKARTNKNCTGATGGVFGSAFTVLPVPREFRRSPTRRSLPIAEVPTSVNDTSHFDSVVNRPKEQHIASETERLTAGHSKIGADFADVPLRSQCVTCVTQLCYPVPSCGRIVAGDYIDNVRNVVCRVRRVCDVRLYASPDSIARIRSATRL